MTDTEIPKRDMAYWLKFIAKSAFISVVILYLVYEAEFTAIRAVYEAY